MPTDKEGYQPILDITENEATTKTRWFSKRICGKKITIWQLLFSLILLLMGLGLLFSFVVIPQSIQAIINKTELGFTGIMMDNINNSSFTISANGTISHSGPFSAKIVPSGSFSIYYLGYQLGNMNIPEISVKGGAAQTPMIINNNVVTITNASHFTVYGHDLLNSPQANWELRGHVDVTALGVTFHKFKFEKIVTIAGMSGLANTTVEYFNLPGDAPGLLYLSINTSIFNPSVVGMHVGDVHFDVLYQNWTIGYLLASDMLLNSGVNQLQMTGIVQPTNNDSLPSVSQFFSQYISGTNSIVSVRGNSGPANSPEWLNMALQSLEISTILPGANPLTLQLIDDLALADLVLTLPGAPGSPFTEEDRMVNMSSSVSSRFKAPFPIQLDIYEVSMSANMMVGDKVLGTIVSSPFFPSVSNQTSSVLQFNMSGVTMQIVDVEGFSSMVSQLVLSPSSEFNLSGVATAMVRSQIGNLVLTNITFQNQTIRLIGFNGFAGDIIQIMQPNTHITNGYSWGLKMFLNIALTNPSNVHIRFAALSFDYYYKGEYFGNTSLTNVDLAVGTNYVVSYSNYVKPANLALEREFLSKYLQGNDSTIQLVGNNNNIALMSGALQQLNVSLVFPGQTEQLLAWAELDTIAPPKTTLALHNPTDCNITVVSLTNFQIYTEKWEDYTTLYDTNFSTGFPIGPHGRELTEEIRLGVTWHELKTDIKYAKYLVGNHTLITWGQIYYQIEGYGPVTVDSLQNFTMVGW